MQVVVTGGHGLIGGALTAELLRRGHRVVALGRHAGPGPAGATSVLLGSADAPGALRDAEAVVHLAGSPIAAGRWTQARKQEILNSRTAGTDRLIAALGEAGARPAAFLGASAVGYYGDAGDRPLDESSPAGEDFLADVCRRWEAAEARAAALGARVVHLRTGVVLAPDGGLLGRLLPVFRLGLGGPVGSGEQWLPWISLADEVEAILALLALRDAQGPYNLCAPSPVRSREFAQELGRALGRPARLRLPAALVRLGFGEMGDAVLLSGQRALPRRLEAAGFGFRHTSLRDAIAACLA